MRWDEDGFDRHQIVDQLGLRDVAVEAYRDAGAVVDDVEDEMRDLLAELGVDALLMNTGIAGASDPVRMARAMKHAAIAGREAFLAGRMPKRLYANASSPMQDLIATQAP